VTPNIDKFTATPGQTVFNLSASPASPSKVLGFVNGQEADPGVDFTVVGNVATWLNTSFSLNGDRVIFFYFT
jgi:hypothetical protein